MSLQTAARAVEPTVRPIRSGTGVSVTEELRSRRSDGRAGRTPGHAAGGSKPKKPLAYGAVIGPLGPPRRYPRVGVQRLLRSWLQPSSCTGSTGFVPHTSRPRTVLGVSPSAWCTVDPEHSTARRRWQRQRKRRAGGQRASSLRPGRAVCRFRFRGLLGQPWKRMVAAFPSPSVTQVWFRFSVTSNLTLYTEYSVVQYI